MIAANELRIGNWVNITVEGKDGVFNQNEVIEEIRKDVILFNNGIHAAYRMLQPIPLTKDILMKCGFKLTRQYLSGFTGRLPRVLVKDNIVYNSGGFFGGSNESECDKPGISIARDRICITSFRLHDLQNKYFALVGKELEVKL